MIGKKIKELRLSRKMTQEELGKIIGVTTSMIGMYETGARNPSYAVLKKIAEYFNVTTDYLLGCSETPQRNNDEKISEEINKDIERGIILGSNIRRIRKSLGISINKLSTLSGISLGYLSDLENNKSSNPTKETLEKIAKALGVPVEKLLEDSSKDNNKETEYNIRIKDPNIRAIARAGEKMTPEEAAELRRFAERLFPNAFKKSKE